MTALFSVIVPAYNVEEYIERCLTSVARQLAGDESELELIVINDGSKDGTLAKIEAVRQAYPKLRMTVIDQPNQGHSHTRNVGLGAASGAYLGFLDSDDFWLPGYWTSVKPVLAEGRADIVEYDATLVDEADRPGDAMKICLARDGYHPLDEGLLMVYAGRFRNFAWGRVFRAALFDGVNFPAGRRYEDVVTTPYLYSVASSVHCINRPLIAYRLRQGHSVTSAAPLLADVHDLNRSAVEAFQHAETGASRLFWMRIALKIHVMICMHILRLPLRERFGACALGVRSYPRAKPAEFRSSDWARVRYPAAYVGFLSARQAARRLFARLRGTAPAG